VGVLRIGVPREVKPGEYRVALTPAAAHVLVQDGHEVVVEAGAGLGSGFADADFRAAGCRLGEARDVWACDLVAKVKEPQPEEYPRLRPGLVLFGFLHLAPAPALTAALLEAGVVAIALETVQREDGSLPLLQPMSEIAGRMSVQVGAYFLQRPHGGRGILLGGVPGVAPAHVVVVGAGTVGRGAARIAAGLGARVTVLDVNPERLREVDEHLGGRVETLASHPRALAEVVATADVLVGAVLVPGARAPRVVTAEMVAAMRPGSVVVDVAVDQGGCVQTCDHPTTHRRPTYVRHGVLHYAVPNMPGAVPRTATEALANATLPYLRRLAGEGWRAAVAADPALARGVNVALGELTCAPVAAAQGRRATPLSALL
jgi:alanine dehydrogenase